MDRLDELSLAIETMMANEGIINKIKSLKSKRTVKQNTRINNVSKSKPANRTAKSKIKEYTLEDFESEYGKTFEKVRNNIITEIKSQISREKRFATAYKAIEIITDDSNYVTLDWLDSPGIGLCILEYDIHNCNTSNPRDYFRSEEWNDMMEQLDVIIERVIDDSELKFTSDCDWDTGSYYIYLPNSEGTDF